MQPWEKKFAEYCLKKKYLSLDEIQKLISFQKESIQKGKEAHFIQLLACYFRWSKERLESVWQSFHQEEALTPSQAQTSSQEASIEPSPASGTSEQKTSEGESWHEEETVVADPIDSEEKLEATRPQPTSSAKKPLLPEKLGRYVIKKSLGEGGMGHVYLAYDPDLDRDVALKVLIPRVALMLHAPERFMREAQASAKLNHPNVVRIYDVGKVGLESFFTMEYIPGSSFKEIIEERALPLVDLLKIFQGVLRGVSYAHENNIIHRDLKPANILVDTHKVAHVMDFGLAKILGNSTVGGLTEPGSVLGSPAYMSPEQASSSMEKIGKPADVYSLGAILYEILTQERLVKTTQIYEMFNQIMRQAPKPPHEIRPNVPLELEHICLKALSKDISARYPSAIEMAQDFEAFLQAPEPSPRVISLNKSSKLGLLRFQYYSLDKKWVTFCDIPVSQTTVTIGRNRDNDICIRVPENGTRSLHISGQHCKLTANGDLIHLMDLKSTNGTFLNGEKLEGNKLYPLTSECTIDLGKKEVRFIFNPGFEKPTEILEPAVMAVSEKIDIITTLDGRQTIAQ